MEKFIPFEKLSKRKKREMAKQQRKTWGSLNPITRVSKSEKLYNRKKSRQQKDDYLESPGFFILVYSNHVTGSRRCLQISYYLKPLIIHTRLMVLVYHPVTQAPILQLRNYLFSLA